MHPGSPSDPSRTGAAEAKPRCVYLILKPHSQISRYQVRILLLRQNQGTYIFRVSSPTQSRSKAVVCVSTPRMYSRSGYFLVQSNLKITSLFIMKKQIVSCFNYFSNEKSINVKRQLFESCENRLKRQVMTKQIFGVNCKNLENKGWMQWMSDTLALKAMSYNNYT